MKGLMIKDFCLLGNQKKILPVYLLLMVWFTIMHSDGFAFPFLTMMASILTVGTISYDEIDHSQGYLFTLPVERKTYVQGKFILGWIVVAVSLALAAACSLVRALVSPGASLEDLGTTALLSAVAGAAMLAVMIPIRIRFTGDQGRIVLFAAFGVVALAGILLTKVLPGLVCLGLHHIRAPRSCQKKPPSGDGGRRGLRPDGGGLAARYPLYEKEGILRKKRKNKPGPSCGRHDGPCFIDFPAPDSCRQSGKQPKQFRRPAASVWMEHGINQKETVCPAGTRTSFSP